MLGNVARDLERIRAVSARLDRRLSELRPSDSDVIDGLSPEELRDLGKIVGLADFMLTKYQDKREMRSILRWFVKAISDSARSIEAVDDEISCLILEAEDSLGKVRDVHARIDAKSDLNRGGQAGSKQVQII